MPIRTAYCGSKFAVDGFFKSLRLELNNKVHICIVSPPTIPGTNFRKNSLAPPKGEIEGKIVGTPEKVADYVMTGADRRVDNLICPTSMWFGAHFQHWFPRALNYLQMKQMPADQRAKL